jgi:predicted RNase H-like nuclease (RuvC/YqgF family)
MDDRDRELQACHETVEQLQEENHDLRTSAGVFGQLAERLNNALREERRTQPERRRGERATHSRRAT